jgi:hypothetical protein
LTLVVSNLKKKTSKEYNEFAMKFMKANRKYIHDINDIAFIQEGFKKLGILRKGFIKFAEPKVTKTFNNIERR